MRSPFPFLLPFLGRDDDLVQNSNMTKSLQERRRRLPPTWSPTANQVVDCKTSPPSWTWTEDFLHGGGYEYEYEDFSDGGETTDAYSSPMLGERGGERTSSWPSSTAASGENNGRENIQTRRGTLSGSRQQQRRGNNRIPQGQRKHSPVVYQYFARSDRRGPPSPDELNFILLGPNVDHWKSVGQILASRGFNVMACERVEEEHTEETIQGARERNGEATSIDSDAPHLVLEVADSLKWNRIVLLGCEEDVILAMETAMMLAPERVAGLILCGDLSDANRLAKEVSGVDDVDTFLHRALDCPFVIIWDGGSHSSVVSGSSAHDAIENAMSSGEGRCVILGGGSAPHRTKPEQFAWIMTRFVEERLDYHPRDHFHYHHQQQQQKRQYNRNARTIMSDTDTEEEEDPYADFPRAQYPNGPGFLRNLNLPFGINSLVSPEGRLLLGRAVAAALFYTSCAKVLVVQYGNLRYGVMSVKSGVDSVGALRRKIFQATGAFIVNFGYIPRLFNVSFRRAKENDDEDPNVIDVDKPGKDEGEEITKPNDTNKGLDDDATENSNNKEEATDDADEEYFADDDDGGGEDEDEKRNRFRPLFFLDGVIT